MGEKEYTRKDLYELVWSVTQKEAAEALGIKKWHLPYLCEKHNVPRPESGYWTRQRLGRAEPRPDLPPQEDDGSVIFSTVQHEESAEPDILDDAFRESAEALIEREDDPRFAIVVPGTLSRPNVAVAATRACLERQSEDHLGILSTHGNECFNVRITRLYRPRALLILDAFAKACEKRGFKLAPSDRSWGGHLGVLVLDKRVELRLTEKVRRSDKPEDPNAKRERRFDYYKHDYVPTGILTLEVGGQALVDRSGYPLETQLREAMVGLLEGAKSVRRAEIRRAQREQEEREDAERRYELKKMKDEEMRRVEDLQRQVEGWGRSRQIREYAEAVRALLIERDGKIAAGGEAEKWLKWALEQADRADPLRPSPYSILDEPEPGWSM